MKTYLVTGGAGFIGSNFILHLLDTHIDICVVNFDKLTYAGNLENLKSIEGDMRYHFIKGDVCDRELLKSAFVKFDIDYVVNFAAESHVDRSIVDPEIFVQTNVLGTLHLLNTAKKYWSVGENRYKEGCKFLQVSTDEVYGSLGAKGVFTESSLIDPHSPYSASKASADLLVKSYYDTFRLPINITRCSNNYGFYQFPEKLIPLMITNALKKKKMPIYGDGRNIRDWLYVEDHCRAIDMVLCKGKVGETYNIGGNNERTNVEIVHEILYFLNQYVDSAINEDLICYIEDRKGHDRRYAIDAKKIQQEIGWMPNTTFDEGIKKTITWYIENDLWLQHVVNGEYEAYYRRQYGE